MRKKNTNDGKLKDEEEKNSRQLSEFEVIITGITPINKNMKKRPNENETKKRGKKWLLGNPFGTKTIEVVVVRDKGD